MLSLPKGFLGPNLNLTEYLLINTCNIGETPKLARVENVYVLFDVKVAAQITLRLLSDTKSVLLQFCLV